jgi:magnesium transporter
MGGSEEDQMGDARTRAYRKGALHAKGFPVADLSEHLDDPDCFVWVDLCGPTPDELHEVADELGLHELAVEDALEPHQRPKLDHYDSHLFLSCHSADLDVPSGELRKYEIDAFIGDRWLITVRMEPGWDMDAVEARWDRSPELASNGVSFLLYGLLDVVVDGYFETIQAFDEYYDTVSDGIFADEPLDPSQQRSWFQVRRALVAFHRLVVPMREAVSALMRREQHAVSEQLYPYFQDVYDHILRVSESTDSVRDLVSTIVDTNLSLRDYRQNLIMKKVTSWAGIIAIPTLITGVYGMNIPYPGFGRTWGAWTAFALSLGCSVALYVQFKKRDWL